jgi:hypothetical protein
LERRHLPNIFYQIYFIMWNKKYNTQIWTF